MTKLRLRQLVIAAPGPEVADDLRKVFQLGKPFHDKAVAEFGLKNSVFSIGDQFIEVVWPVKDDAPLHRFLERNGGAGGYMVIFETDDIDAARTRLDGAGIRRVWNIDLDDIAASHIHPADVGAAIISIDETRPWGSWRWGGPKWKDEAVEGELSGAILESPDPNGLASRWAAALGIPATTHPDVTRIALDDDQTLIFQKGEKTMLEGFCVSLQSAMKALERADDLGLKSQGDTVWVGGVRFVLNND
ncbi:VOC family protein [Henriciella sp. AS95]|uniref:VOC family protein n=1 Tax=Henriciella sp. AS95 TaxID=3135782 RepID=UPI0031766CFF